MTALRNILDDLIEKKLWPIAVALVVALIALPLALGGGGSSDDAGAPAVPRAEAPIAGTAPAAASPVSLEAGQAVDKRTRKGAVRDPFKQLAKARKTDAAGSPDASAASPATTGSAPSVGAGTGSGSSGYSPTRLSSPDPPVLPPSQSGSPRSTTAPDDDDRAAVVFRFAERGEDGKRFDDPRKLTGIPSASYPLLVFAGVRSDGKALRFVVNPLTRVTGDGRCRPSRDRCRTLEVRPGGTAFVDVLASPTKVVNYRLDVVRTGR